MIVAQAFPLLIVARIIQGIGSGVATPLMINIILEQSPRSKIGRLMGVGSLVITVAPAIGPTVGGAVTTVLPWRAIFVIAIPLVLIAACIGMKCIEQKTPTEAAILTRFSLGPLLSRWSVWCWRSTKVAWPSVRRCPASQPHAPALSPLSV